MPPQAPHATVHNVVHPLSSTMCHLPSPTPQYYGLVNTPAMGVLPANLSPKQYSPSSPPQDSSPSPGQTQSSERQLSPASFSETCRKSITTPPPKRPKWSGGTGDSDLYSSGIAVDDWPGRLTNTSVLTVKSCTPEFYFQHQDRAYPMNQAVRGSVCIINVSGQSERQGTDYDRDRLIELFTALHFDASNVYNDEDNLSAKEILKKVRAFAALPSHRVAQCCVLCLLSHGSDDQIYGSDGEPVSLTTLLQLLDNEHCRALRGKPKLVFVQACRGPGTDDGVHYDRSDSQSDVTTHDYRQHPTSEDFLIAYPTIRGYRAWREPDEGSWFVDAVVQVFARHAYQEDICALLHRVNEMVSRRITRSAKPNDNEKSQCTTYESRLQWPYLYFFPGYTEGPQETYV